MASRQNISGRKGGFGRGVLSKVYGAAQKQAKANRQSGAPPGSTSLAKGGFFGGKRKQRLGITQEQKDAGITNVDEGREAAGLSKRSLAERVGGGTGLVPGATGGFAAAARGMRGGMKVAGNVSAPGLDALTGGGPPVTPNVTLNPMPPAHAPVQRGMGAEGAALLASRGVTPGAPAPAPSAPPSRGGVRERLAKKSPVFNPSAMRPAPPPAAAPAAAPEVSENIAVPETPALKEGQGSVRSRGMHRSRASLQLLR